MRSSFAIQSDGQEDVMAADGSWSIDPQRSRIGFVASHVFGLGRVKGTFAGFSGQITVEGGELTAARAAIAATGVATGSARRDADLRSPAFLDVESHPEIAYAATEVESEGDGRYRMSGALTVKGNSAEVPLNVKLTESGETELHLRALGTFNRRNVGVTPGAKGVIVGRLIGVEIEVVASRR